MRKTVSFDFDGVIHPYTDGWNNGQITPPLDLSGVRSAQALDFAVVISTSRPIAPMAQPLREAAPDLTFYFDHQMEFSFWHDADRILVTNRKVAAVAYIDDRAIYHCGEHSSWAETMDEVAELATRVDGWVVR